MAMNTAKEKKKKNFYGTSNPGLAPEPGLKPAGAQWTVDLCTASTECRYDSVSLRYSTDSYCKHELQRSALSACMFMCILAGTRLFFEHKQKWVKYSKSHL